MASDVDKKTKIKTNKSDIVRCCAWPLYTCQTVIMVSVALDHCMFFLLFATAKRLSWGSRHSLLNSVNIYSSLSDSASRFGRCCFEYIDSSYAVWLESILFSNESRHLTSTLFFFRVRTLIVITRFCLFFALLVCRLGIWKLVYSNNLEIITKLVGRMNRIATKSTDFVFGLPRDSILWTSIHRIPHSNAPCRNF